MPDQDEVTRIPIAHLKVGDCFENPNPIGFWVYRWKIVEINDSKDSARVQAISLRTGKPVETALFWKRNGCKMFSREWMV